MSEIEGLKQKIIEKAKTFRKWHSEYDKHYNNGDYVKADKILDAELVKVDDVVAVLNEAIEQIKKKAFRHTNIPISMLIVPLDDVLAVLEGA